MSKFRLSRRALLRGAGSIAIALPWLEIMGDSRSARAGGDSTAQRFVCVYQPGGTVRSRYTPTGSESAPILSSILAPLDDMLARKKLLILDGFAMDSAVGEQHQAGIIALLTGSVQDFASSTTYATGPSLDQVLATRLAAQQTRVHKSLELAVRWATGKSKGLESPMNALTYDDSPFFSPIQPRLDPVAIFKSLFGTPQFVADATSAAALARKRSVLDYVDHRYAALAQRLGSADKAKLDQHLTKIRELETSLSAVADASSSCKSPAQVDTSDYNPRTGLNSADDGSIKDVLTDSAIPKVGKYMMDMLVMALACDLTPVATLQWSDTEAKHTFPWLGLSEHHHFYQHDGGFRPDECTSIATWYSEMHAYLLGAMDAVDMGGHSLLDESVVLFGSELQDPPTHQKNNMPFLLAGGGGGLRGGRWLRYASQSHNNLLVSIAQLFGDERTTFGTPDYCTGPCGGLT
jgi:hypothetical protein